jgi:chromosome segregation ATPase
MTPWRVLFTLTWFVAGGLASYAVLVRSENLRLSQDLDTLRDAQLRYEEQVAINLSQREDFESRVGQLEENLQSARLQLTNLSTALQEAREMMTPPAEEIRRNAGAGDVQ